MARCSYLIFPRITYTYISYVCFVGKIAWTREEALASLLSVEMVDLPVSHIQAKMEDEFGSQEGECIGQIIRICDIH